MVSIVTINESSPMFADVLLPEGTQYVALIKGAPRKVLDSCSYALRHPDGDGYERSGVFLRSDTALRSVTGQ